MTVASFKNLIVWQKSFALVKQIYELTNQLPKHEQFGLASQLQRCAVSIPSNIAEGQQRNNLKEYCQFLGIARGSAGELETQLLLVKEIYKIDTTDLVSKTQEIQKMLCSLTTKLKSRT
ncbi:MAG: four helix bundle protein [Candidatus Saccharimonadales bacterium]